MTRTADRDPVTPRPIDPLALRATLGRFASGVTVVTCPLADGSRHGATATAFTAISLDPPLVQVAMTRTSRACSYLDGAPFAVNVLAADQVDVAMHFAGRPQDTPPVWRDGPTAPTLAGAAATFSCKPWRTYDGGDHLIFIGEVVEATHVDAEPLIFHGSAFHRIGPRTADATWNGSCDDPHTGWFDATTVFTPIPAATVSSTR